MPFTPLTRATYTDPQAEPATDARPETWTPEGVIISQRCRGLVDAIVLVYTADAGINGGYYAVSCLGCYFSVNTKREPHHYFASPREAGAVANDHAAQCRALNRPLPARPDDDTARKIIRRVLDRQQRSELDVTVSLHAFLLDRLALQRSAAWIEDELTRLAAEQPDFLTARKRGHDNSTEFTITGTKTDSATNASR